MSSPRTCDVLVAGGGPAGASLALRLARAGCSVILLERGAFDRFRMGESLPPAAADRVRKLGLWDAFLQTRPEPVYGIQSAWGSEELQSSTFLGNPLLNGWHLDRPRFDAMLNVAAEEAGAHVLRQTRARYFESTAQGHWLVTASSQQEDWPIDCRFLVDATGRSAHVSRRLGIGRHQIDSLLGIAALFEEPSSGAPLPSRIEAHPLGWWYSAGLPGGRVIAIFFTDSDLSAGHGLTRPVEWSRLLRQSHHTNARLKGCTPPAALQVFPAASHRLDRAAGDSWLALGDALIGRDPLSSSGIDFALASAERASRVLCARANGAPDSADAYNAEVRSDFASYLQQRRAYYAMERRWPNALFWERRQIAIDRNKPARDCAADGLHADGVQWKTAGVDADTLSP